MAGIIGHVRVRVEDKAAQKLHQFLSSVPTVQRYGGLATTSWLFVTFGDSGSRKQNCHERGEGGGRENPYESMEK
jgi:hypothetical protein